MYYELMPPPPYLMEYHLTVLSRLLVKKYHLPFKHFIIKWRFYKLHYTLIVQTAWKSTLCGFESTHNRKFCLFIVSLLVNFHSSVKVNALKERVILKEPCCKFLPMDGIAWTQSLNKISQNLSHFKYLKKISMPNYILEHKV